MRARTGVKLAMWALVLWGLFQAGQGVTSHGMSSEAECSWINIGPDGEEHPSPMESGDRCLTRDGDERTYEEQWAFQREAGEDVVTGTWVLGVGALGLAGLSVERRLQKAWARRPYEARTRHSWSVRTRRLRGRV
ncbi:hypothetical protein [Streptomyces sp. CB02400]|uniref:hypothetical protein n=1 Tax=Streptomyces sp. CB02400 TaxID=1703944 RepID=UPI0011611270|nr:hypothetical protein [Streptomyces sp. CB02400]